MIASEKSAAILTVKSQGKMSAKGRKQIAAWLRRKADHLARHGKDYTENKFTARYLYS